MNPGPKRTIAEIQQEYQGLCLKAGHLQYQVFTLKKDLALVNDELRDLNLEASQVKAEEERAAKVVAEVEKLKTEEVK